MVVYSMFSITFATMWGGARNIITNLNLFMGYGGGEMGGGGGGAAKKFYVKCEKKEI